MASATMGVKITLFVMESEEAREQMMNRIAMVMERDYGSIRYRMYGVDNEVLLTVHYSGIVQEAMANVATEFLNDYAMQKEKK